MEYTREQLLGLPRNQFIDNNWSVFGIWFDTAGQAKAFYSKDRNRFADDVLEAQADGVVFESKLNQEPTTSKTGQTAFIQDKNASEDKKRQYRHHRLIRDNVINLHKSGLTVDEIIEKIGVVELDGGKVRGRLGRMSVIHMITGKPPWVGMFKGK